MKSDHLVTVESLRFDLSVRRSWVCEYIGSSGPMIELVGRFDRQVEHPHLGVIGKGTLSHEYFWSDRWYNIFRFHEPSGAFRNFYCNICMPAEFDGRSLRYVDLDLDIVVWPDGRLDHLDEDDFERNADKYPRDVIAKAREASDEVERMIADREFPFDTYA